MRLLRWVMTMKNETVSIIVPVHNAAQCITDTILSVKSQTFSDWELILVDDDSDDDSVNIIREFLCDRIKLIETKGNKSAALTRNRGLEEATGRYIAFLDADDLWLNDKLEKQVAFMKEKEVAFSFTGYEFADADGVGVRKIVRVPETLCYRDAIKNTTIFTSTVMFDLKKMDRKLLIMPNVPSEDSATWWQILRTGYRAYGLDEALTLYRRTEGSLSSNKLVAIKRIWNLYRNVEHFNVFYSAYCFINFAINAVIRRL